MNYISVFGFIASAPTPTLLENGMTYTSFRLRVHGSYLDSKGDPYSYVEEHTIICLNILADFVRSIPRSAEVEVVGELRSRLHVLRFGGPVAVEVVYPRPEIIANTITFRERLVARTDPDDTLIGLYQLDPA